MTSWIVTDRESGAKIRIRIETDPVIGPRWETGAMCDDIGYDVIEAVKTRMEDWDIDPADGSLNVTEEE